VHYKTVSRYTCTVRAAGILVAISAALAVCGCGFGAAGYSPERVKMAFQVAGIHLVAGVPASHRIAGAPLARPAGSFSGTIYTARRGSEFFVIVYTGADSAIVAYRIERGAASSRSFDRLAGNVLVTADDLTTTDRQEVAHALALLTR
jgi:hypothetical protein